MFFLKRKLAVPSPEQDPRVTRFLALIDEQVTAADQLLTTGASTEGLFGAERAQVELGPLVQSACDEALRLRPEAVSRVFVESADDSTVDADPCEVVLAVRCLVDNAIEAAEGLVRIRAYREEGEACVDVRDDGPGFSELAGAEALTAFFTTKRGHSGLGLNIAARVARRYGGRLVVEPHLQGPGVSVQLRFPLEEEERRG